MAKTTKRATKTTNTTKTSRRPSTKTKPANNLLERRVKDLMVTDVVAVAPQDALNEALALMVENRVSALPVVDARDRCVGVVSATDLLGLARDLGEELSGIGQLEGMARELFVEKLGETDVMNGRVQEQMTPDVVSVGPDATVAEAAGTLVRNRVHRLMVVDKQRRLLGIVSTMDIMRLIAEDGTA